ncbi:MAG TPA: hypothetical protein ENK18_23655 [Deltaproteobacteria bacterium]|nr:hypothetical protein [Deltaproteobacteria bacterium]
MKRLLRAGCVLSLVLSLAAGGAVVAAGVLFALLPRDVPLVVEEPLGPYPVPEPPEGPLSGLVVYLSAGHGWLLHRVRHDGEPIAWGRQRSVRYGMVEDDWTAAFVADYLAPAIEAAGGTVIALRERDRNPVAAISDDGDPSHYAERIVVRVEDPLAQGGSYLRLEPDGGSVWWLEVPYDGHWYLYTRWVASEAHDDRAVYTINAGGVSRQVVVDQRAHGGHWWPLADLCLFGGDLVEVVLNGSGGGLPAADAVRLGGGSYVFAPPFDWKVRNRPLFDVAMPHQIEHLGAPEALSTYECGNPVSDMRLRPHWASWASPDGEEAVYLSIHTNASPRGRARGLTVFAGIDKTPPTPAGPASVRLANALERSIFETVRSRDPGYVTRGVRLGNFSEISPVHNDLTGALLELGFHDDRGDAARLQTPQFREDAAKGTVEGLIQWRRGADEGR